MYQTINKVVKLPNKFQTLHRKPWAIPSTYHTAFIV